MTRPPTRAALSRSDLDHATRRPFLAAHLGLQFLDLLFKLNNDTCKLIKTGANFFDRFSAGAPIVSRGTEGVRKVSHFNT
jgi:hypothetical protein